MSKRITVAASFLLPAALLLSTGCKSKPSTPEQASQPAAQTAPAPSNATTPAGPGGPSSSSSTAPATPAQPAPAAGQPASAPAANPPAGAPPANVATNAPAPAAAPPPPPPPPPPIVVPAGTALHVTLVQAIGSKLSQEGTRFDATLSSSVVVKGQKAIPAGTRAVGTVVEAHPSGRFKGGATLVVQLNSIHLNGQIYPIRTNQWSSESKGKGKRTAGMIGGGTAGGALIGGLAGGGKGALIGGAIGAGAGTVGAATGNRDITLKSESPLTFQLASSLTLPPKTGGGTTPQAATGPPQP
jgi:hypothetical protein